MNPDPDDSKTAEEHSPQARQRRSSHIARLLGVLALFAALVAVAYFGQHLFKRLGPPERCREIKEVDGQIYKVNPCTGQFRLLGDARPRDSEK